MMYNLYPPSDWNTSADESSLSQLRQVSCVALACLLKHTGLLLYASQGCVAGLSICVITQATSMPFKGAW